MALLYFSFGEVDLRHISFPSMSVSGSHVAAVAAPFVETGEALWQLFLDGRPL